MNLRNISRAGRIGGADEIIPASSNNEAGKRNFITAQRRYDNVRVRDSEMKSRLCYECGQLLFGERKYQEHIISHECTNIAYCLFYMEQQGDDTAEASTTAAVASERCAPKEVAATNIHNNNKDDVENVSTKASSSASIVATEASERRRSQMTGSNGSSFKADRPPRSSNSRDISEELGTIQEKFTRKISSSRHLDAEENNNNEKRARLSFR